MTPIEQLTQQANQAQKQLDMIFKQKGLMYDPTTKTAIQLPKVNTSINAGQIGNIKAIPPIQQQNNVGMSALQSNLIDFQSSAQTQVQPAPLTNQQIVQQQIMGLIKKQGTQGAKANEINQQEDVEKKGQLARDLTTKYEKKTKEYEKLIKERLKNKEGTFGDATNEAVRVLETERDSRLADIAIDQKKARGDYEGALETAKMKLDAEFAPIDNQIKGLTTLYSFLQDDYTESEKLQAQAVISDKNALRDFNYAKELNIQQAGIKASQQASESGIYTSKQLTALTRLNDGISKSQDYSKTVGMKTYADNIQTALANKNGVSDISAINQFQKIIDEGAVTRDQDVVLIRSAQSLLGVLQTKIKGLTKGEKLNENQRTQMSEMVNQFYNNQIRSLQTSPYVQAKNREAELYGLNVSDTILAELTGFTKSGQGQNPQTFHVGNITYTVGADGKYYPPSGELLKKPPVTQPAQPAFSSSKTSLFNFSGYDPSWLNSWFK